MVAGNNHSRVLSDDRQLGPFPLHRLKQVDVPTNIITENVQRVDYPAKTFTSSTAQKRHIRHDPLTLSQREVMFQLAGIEDDEIADSNANIPEDPEILSRHIKKLGYFLKADMVGICHLPRSAIFKHDSNGDPVNIDYKYAIVVVMKWDYSVMKATSGNDSLSGPIASESYQHLAFVTQNMARYIRKLGYPASAEHLHKYPGAYQVQIPPLLLWAGIGEISRLGIILNPFIGAAFKAAAVLTDMPLVPDKPVDFGLQDFCKHCMSCAHECPSRALSTEEKVMYNGYETWKINSDRCSKYLKSENTPDLCFRCIRVCPWTSPLTWPHNFVRWAVRHSSIARRFAIGVDAIKGSPKVDEEEKWWFDF
jgi:reductive dehalogenase